MCFNLLVLFEIVVWLGANILKLLSGFCVCLYSIRSFVKTIFLYLHKKCQTLKKKKCRSRKKHQNIFCKRTFLRYFQDWSVMMLKSCHPMAYTVYIRVQWFWLFSHFEVHITTHPWHPKGSRIWKLAKKKFQLHPWPAEIFGKNRKMRFLGLVSKFNFRSPVWQIFTIFSAGFIYGILNTHTKFEVSKSKIVVTREWSRQGLKFICKLYLTKIFKKNSFWTHPSSTVFWQCILSP